MYFMIQGMYSEITGPTLPYLKQRVDSNYEQIGRALAARSVGFLTGSLTGGILCDRYNGAFPKWNKNTVNSGNLVKSENH